MFEGNYKYKTIDWKERLNNALLKTEIEWVANNNGGFVDFLKPYAGDIETLKNYLRFLGFRIKEVYDCEGDWVRLTNGICIDLTTCFCIRFR